MTIVWVDSTFFIYLLSEHLGCWHLSLIGKMLLWRVVKVFLCEHLVLLGIHLEMDLMGQVVPVFNFLRNCLVFSTATTPFYL